MLVSCSTAALVTGAELGESWAAGGGATRYSCGPLRTCHQRRVWVLISSSTAMPARAPIGGTIMMSPPGRLRVHGYHTHSMPQLGGLGDSVGKVQPVK